MTANAANAANAADADAADATNLAELGATEAARLIAAGSIGSEQLVAACLARIEARDGAIEAWTHLDAGHALDQARRADEARAAGRPLGPLHGVPVGIKDIFDTHDMPTENGSPLHAGRTPRRDATAVARLRQAGAVIMGKTVTTEFAAYAPGKTKNPHDSTRTPGGSSSGSAAAVASGMVPLAIGTQTAGSTIRPASFCGIVGFKPTHGLISRHRMLALSRVLDHVGVFARSVEDAALLADQIIGHDGHDPDVAAVSRGSLAAIAAGDPPTTPTLALVRTPAWDMAEAATREAFAEFADFLGPRATERTLPAPFDEALELHKTIMESDIALNLGAEYDRGREQISEAMRGMIERGREHRAIDYLRAIERREALAGQLDELAGSVDAILTLSATGEAPLGLEATGSPAFCTLWTYCGLPAVSLPLLRGPNGLPLGLQLVGRRGDDGRLLRTARWLVETAAGRAKA